MWYNRLSFLLKKEYINNDAYPCVFIKKSLNGFCIILVYVDDINIIGTRKEIEEASSCLKTKFEMKDLGKIKCCLACRSSTSLKEFVMPQTRGSVDYPSTHENTRECRVTRHFSLKSGRVSFVRGALPKYKTYIYLSQIVQYIQYIQSHE